jgi:tetratricopeptide (TPR) repeat protein
MLLSRAAALDQKGQLDDAISLLETMQSFDIAKRFVGKRAELLTDRGIQAGNARQWEKAVADLRQALSLNPHLPRTRQNFILALQGAAISSHEADDEGQARILFEEAIRVLEEALQSDPQNAEMKKQLQETRTALALLGGPTGAAADPFEELKKILEELPTTPDNQSISSSPVPERKTPLTAEAQLRQIAEGKAKRRDYQGAVADLEKALRQSPQDTSLQQTLIGVLEEYADDLLGKRDFEQAALVAERGLGYAPDHEGLKATLAAVHLFQPTPKAK